MLENLRVWNGRASTLLARIAAFILALLAVVTFCDVVGRYLFNNPFTFTVEFTELAMGLIVYFGIGLTTHENEHISVDVVTLRLRVWTRALLAALTNLLALAFLVFMVWRLWLQAALLLHSGDLTPIWGVHIWPFACAMAVGAILLLTGILMHLAEAVRVLAAGDSSPPAATPPSHS